MAITTFASGWIWLVKNNNGNLEIVNTENARKPLTENKKPLITCDLWEHAYYIDYRNSRDKYVESFWNVVNWDFASKNFE
ncbi:MAG: Fe-Mn family superoxide dismutase [Leptospiraceae bacterium]|nr:Fe-Mn family superoxide dismutase [Leptospiraceae bacterium]